MGTFGCSWHGIAVRNEGDIAGAKAAYEVAIDSGHVDVAPMAARNLGMLLEKQGDVAGAKTAYQVAIGQADVAPKAAVNLAVMLEKQEDVAGARPAIRWPSTLATPNGRPRLRSTWRGILTEQGDIAQLRRLIR